MTKTLTTFKDFFLFKNGPQDLPHATSFLVTLTFITIALRYFAIYLENPFHLTQGPSLGIVLFNIILTGIFVFIALKIKKHPERFAQTFLAFIITILAQAIVTLLASVLPLAVAAFFSVVFSIWSLAIFSHILHHSLEIKILPAVLLVIAFELIQGLILMQLLLHMGFNLPGVTN